MSDRPQSVLNENQRRALSTRLGMIERHLCDVERLAAGEPTRGAVFQVTNDLTEEQKSAVLSLTGEARGIISELRDRFGLEARREDVRRLLFGLFSVLWAILEDTHAAKLEGFGGVSPELSRLLDPKLDELIEVFERIRAAAK
ncbi:MAG: hypothetical protein LC746_09100 [Acidobacteria bacterium]|nr:hypothetical protein [Acidobacteriota bacterium]